MSLLKQVVNSDLGKQYLDKIGLGTRLPNYIIDKMPSVDFFKRKLLDPILQKTPAYDMGGAISGGKRVGGNDIMRRMGIVPFIGGYENGGIVSDGQLTTVIPSTALSSFNQRGNIRPNGVVINDSQQSLRNRNMI